MSYRKVSNTENKPFDMEKIIKTYRSSSEPCPIRDVLDRIGDKWSTLIILILSEEGTLRFNQLHQAIGDISQKMLTVTLKTLQEDGLVSRKMYPEIPPRVEYTLTETGESLVPYIQSLAEWASKNMTGIKRSRKQHTAAI